MATAKTSVSTIAIFDGLTGEIIEREATQEELANLQLVQAEAAAQQSAQAAKAAARQSALAKLAELGLTEEEIAAL